MKHRSLKSSNSVVIKKKELYIPNTVQYIQKSQDQPLFTLYQPLHKMLHFYFENPLPHNLKLGTLFRGVILYSGRGK